MENKEAQARAIKLSMDDQMAENKQPMGMEGRIHTCPSCGHEMPMDEVMGKAGAIGLSSSQMGENGAHMDREGQVK